jgi:hypothetical protein
VIRSYLEKRNREILRDLKIQIQQIRAAQTPFELSVYKNTVLARCKALCKDVEQNLKYLAIGEDSILEDLLSKTQQASQETRLMSAMWIVPVLRARASDRLCLTTIEWLHQNHPEAAGYPAAFISGHCAIRPFLHIAPIYVFPSVEQMSLLYQPLLFHEFGHLLYAIHKPEMDDLVRELQYEVDEILMPVSQRNDRYSENMTTQRQDIAYTWYAWAQELFCDAIGFEIGGPSFLHAFSNFLNTRDMGNYYRDSRGLQYSSHPVTWLRIHFLSRRAREAGFASLADTVEKEWDDVAQLMGIVEDYHGYYDESVDQVVLQTVEDMIVEASPRHFEVEELVDSDNQQKPIPLIAILNMAWEIYKNDFENYSQWEPRQIENYYQRQ